MQLCSISQSKLAFLFLLKRLYFQPYVTLFIFFCGALIMLIFLSHFRQAALYAFLLCAQTALVQAAHPIHAFLKSYQPYQDPFVPFTEPHPLETESLSLLLHGLYKGIQPHDTEGAQELSHSIEIARHFFANRSAQEQPMHTNATKKPSTSKQETSTVFRCPGQNCQRSFDRPKILIQHIRDDHSEMRLSPVLIAKSEIITILKWYND